MNFSLPPTKESRSRRGLHGAQYFWLLVVSVSLFLAASTASASFLFHDLVSERNLASQGMSSEGFSFGGDSINRFNGALTYSVALGQSYTVGGDLSYGLRLRYSSNIWRFDTSSGVSANADPRFNAGAGWSLSFGELLAPSSAQNSSHYWVYRSPAGTVSRFHDSLEHGGAVVAGVSYTRDGSFLRLTQAGSNAVVAFSDGVEKVFTQTNGEWRFDQKRDLFGNTVSMIYESGQNRLVDSTGREHRIVFIADPAGSGSQVIDRVELAAFGGTTATYQLAYSTANADRPLEDTDPATPLQSTLSLLQSLTRPDGQSTDFEYVPSGAAIPSSGRLSAVTLATGGSLEYDWQIVELPKVPGALHTANAVGIASRTAIPQGSPLSAPAPVGSWTFSMSLDRDRDAALLKPRELTTRVTYPDGFSRDYKFSAFAGGNPANESNPPVNFFLRDYAFPFTKLHATTSQSLFDSEVVLDAADQPLFVRRLSYSFGSCAGCWDQSPSIKAAQVAYLDGSGLVETQSFLNPAGLGRYGIARSWDNQGEVLMRSTFNVFDHGVPAPGASWLATGWTSKVVTEGSESKTLERCIDPATGHVTRERILAGATPGAYDLLRVHEYHSTGERSTTRYFGGDVQVLGTGALCSLTIPSTEQYAEYWHYQFGSLQEQGWLAADGSIFLETYSAILDADTGKVVSDHDASGLTWTYDYDSQGRRISATPPAGHSGERTMVYQPAAGTQGGFTSATIVAADSTVLSQIRTDFDAFGRAIVSKRFSDQGWRSKQTVYDAQGRVVRRIDADNSSTQWLGLDPFGRPTTMRPPEGAAHDRTYVYSGRDVTETVKIGKQWNQFTNSVVEIARSVTTHKDRFERRLSRTITDADNETRSETHTLALDGSVTQTVVTDGSITNTHTFADLIDDRGFQVETPQGDPITGYDGLGHRTVVDFGQGNVAQIFDRAGRLLEQRAGSVSGPIWAQNIYATSSAGNDFRGGQLVTAKRYNRNVPHLPSSEVVITDNYAYTGDGGRLETLTTTIAAGSQLLFEFETSQSLSASGELSSVVFPDCDPSSNDGFSFCQPRATKVMSSERSYGELVRFFGTVGGVHEPWIDGIVRDSAGRITETVLGNGLVETRAYAALGVDKLERLTLDHPSNGFSYDSGLAQYDGLGKLVKLGTERHVSEHAYRLALQPLPVAGDPTTLPTTSSVVDPLGGRTRRAYRVPNAWLGNTGVFDDVTEIYVYGPGNRLVWNRRFNDYQAANFRRSDDSWYLIDPAGRQVREAKSLTHYAGTNPQWANAQVSSVAMQVDYADDSIFQGQRLLGRTNDIANSPGRSFIHEDFFGRRFAESSADGAIQGESSPLF